jgi:hypoxanthine-DNA glycosylase
MENGLKAVVGSRPRTLILGTFPSRQSLTAREYYGNRLNHFWHIIGAHVAFPPDGDYDAKLDALKKAGIALWDVVHACNREDSSADSKIRNPKPNDINGFLADHPSIVRVIFNGKKAHKMFEKLIGELPEGVEFADAPSTSPAFPITDAEREHGWREALHFKKSSSSAPL